MKLIVIVDAQNDFLPIGSFHSPLVYLEIVKKINALRMNLFGSSKEELFKLKDVIKYMGDKKNCEKDFEEYYTCHKEVDDDKSLEEILIFPFDTYRTTRFNEVNHQSKIHMTCDNENETDFNNDSYMSILTMDYHPSDHVSFASTHKQIYKEINDSLESGKKQYKSNSGNGDLVLYKHPQLKTLGDVLDNIPNIKNTDMIYTDIHSIDDIKEYDAITFLEKKIDLWPIHCVRNSYGCKIHKDLIRHVNDIVIKKAQDKNYESYSLFESEEKNKNIIEMLKRKNINTVYLCGFIFEYCVKECALSFQKYNFETFIIEDATAYLGNSEKMKNDLKAKGIHFLVSTELFKNA